MKAWVGATLLCAVLGTASFAAAQESGETDADAAAADAAEAVAKGNELASRGSYADAVPYYEKALRLDPLGNLLAYFNLAQVQKARGNCPSAVLLVQMYATVAGTEEARKEADATVKDCKAQDWPTLALKVDAKTPGTLHIDGILAASDGTFGPLAVPPNRTYEVRFEATDHHSATQEVAVKLAPVTATQTLKPMTFFGLIVVSVDVEGARVRVFEGPSDQTPVLFEGQSPVKEGIKVREGRHFVEVTREGYERWIRNVSVGRDGEVAVEVKMRRSLPTEIQ